MCESEEDARSAIKLKGDQEWPCLFSESDTTGEKSYEEFYTNNEILDLERFESFGIVRSNHYFEEDKLKNFCRSMQSIKNQKFISKEELLDLFCDLIPNFEHEERGKYLDSKM